MIGVPYHRPHRAVVCLHWPDQLSEQRKRKKMSTYTKFSQLNLIFLGNKVLFSLLSLYIGYKPWHH